MVFLHQLPLLRIRIYKDIPGCETQHRSTSFNLESKSLIHRLDWSVLVHCIRLQLPDRNHVGGLSIRMVEHEDYLANSLRHSGPDFMFILGGVRRHSAILSA